TDEGRYRVAVPLAARGDDVDRLPWPVGVEGSSWRLCVLATRKAHREHRAFARLPRHRYVAAHHARELAGDGKAEPRPAELLRGRGIGLGEFFEQLCLLLRSHADAGVGDGELGEVAAIAHLACRKLDLARFGEHAGIAEEIEKNLPQTPRV